MPSRIPDFGVDGVHICARSGRKVVQSDNLLPESQQSLYQMRTDEPRSTRHQPAKRPPQKLFLCCLVGSFGQCLAPCNNPRMRAPVIVCGASQLFPDRIYYDGGAV
jgi:hypothetical protein